MVGIIALLLALAAFTGTVVAVNLWFAPEDASLAADGAQQMSYDIYSAAEKLAQIAGKMVTVPPEGAWAIGIIALVLPALIIFLLVRGAFGGGS